MPGRSKTTNAVRSPSKAVKYIASGVQLAVAGAVAVAHTGISGADQAVAYLVFVLIGSLGIGAPAVVYLAVGERSQAVLARLKDWMGRNNAVIMSILCLVIGAKLIGDAIGGLTG
ncbi:MAG: GAP family protein [Streptosporangiaceae bacterium]